MITRETFCAFGWARPFTPFEIHLRDGRRLVVVRPAATILHPESDRARTLHFLRDLDGFPEETEDRYALSEVVRVELRPDLPWWDVRVQRWCPTRCDDAAA